MNRSQSQRERESKRDGDSTNSILFSDNLCDRISNTRTVQVIFVLIFACCELALYARARLSVNLYGIFSGFVS